MELREIKPTADVEFETAEGLLKFTVQHIPNDRVALDFLAKSRVSDRMRAALDEAILDWNLAHDDGTPWPCDAETKAKLLPQLVVLPLQKPRLGPGGEELSPAGVLLGLALFEFVQNAGNFLKN